MENIGDIFADERIPAWLKYVIIALIILGAIVAIIGTICGAYNKIKTTRQNGSHNTSGDKMHKDNTDGNNPLQEVELEKSYTSLFAEDNKLKTEQIIITKQHNGIVEGTVTLIEHNLDGKDSSKFTYNLKGKFTNNILTAEYYSNPGNIDERGAINLKLIDTNTLSGFCSFSKLASSVDDEIRVSPYVWVAGENIDLLNGTFDFCYKCHEDHKVCCCASEKVDTPVFLNSEIALIRNNLVEKTQAKNTFSKNLAEPFRESDVRQMNRDEKQDSSGNLLYSKCYFYDLKGKKCNIYQGRPIDCRMFPYDIKLSKDKKEYIVGYYTELCDRNLPDHETMKKKAHILRPYFFLLYPYLHIITSDEVCKRLSAADFQEIAKFKDLVF